MADAVVSFAVKNVGSYLIQETTFLKGVRDQVAEMKMELDWMRCFLIDADRRQCESQRVHNWVSEIREIAFDAEDVIERFVLKAALRRRGGALNGIKRYVYLINHLVEVHKVGSRIEAIKTRLTSLRIGLQTYGIKELKDGGEEAAATASSITSRRKRQDYAHVIDHNVVGLDAKISELVAQLLAIEEQHYPVAACGSVVSVYGMGGLGKTTLAKKVYHDSRIRGHFEGYAWVYISQQFKERDVWESILSQLSDKEEKKIIKKMTDDELASELCQVQRDKKCIVVIDDIWSIQAWEMLSPAFPHTENDNKSKILVTTRNEDVALRADHGVYHNSLDTLNESNSLELLINTIQFLGGKNHPINHNLSMEEYAGEMVKQCAGLPLAIIVLGGILATKHELREWERVSVDIKLFLSRGKGKEDAGVTSVLESSYNDLPYYLRSCFLYLSQYPEDHEIRTTKLMQRWMGEGFVSSLSCGDHIDETMDDVAEQYLNELVSRCMIQVGKRSHTGRVKTCRMHDSMRDMCISKAKEENSMQLINIDLEFGNEATDSEKVRSMDKIRRLCIFSTKRNDQLHTNPKSFLSFYRENCSQLRSMFWFDDFNFDDEEWKVMGLMVKKFKLGRVLVLEKSDSNLRGSSNGAGKEIGNLLHLRYLSLRDSAIHVLPSMDNLRCLQTLDLRNCWWGLKLPDSVWRLEQLIYLYLPDDGGICESRKQRVGNFRNLQTLDCFPPNEFDLEQNLAKFANVRKLVTCGYSREIGDIMRIQKLVFNRMRTFSLGKTGRRHGSTAEEIDLEAITTGCPRVYKLCVHGRIGIDKFPAAASWPPSLTKLVLGGSRIDQIHLESLTKLQSLKILILYQNAFIGKEMIFVENDFPQLQHLVLERLVELEAWTVHGGALPSLFRLEIVQCRNLKSVPDRLQFLQELKELQVKWMPYKFRKSLEQGGDDWHKVRHVPSISFLHCDQEPWLRFK